MKKLFIIITVIVLSWGVAGAEEERWYNFQELAHETSKALAGEFVYPKIMIKLFIETKVYKEVPPDYGKNCRWEVKRVEWGKYSELTNLKNESGVSVLISETYKEAQALKEWEPIGVTKEEVSKEFKAYAGHNGEKTYIWLKRWVCD